LVGRDAQALSSLESDLRRHVASVVTAEAAQQAGVLARQFGPTVLVLLTDLKGASQEDLGVLTMHPATSTLPVVVVTPPLGCSQAISAFSRGVAGLVYEPTAAAVVERLTAILGPAGDGARRRAAIDRRGPAVMRRTANYLRYTRHTGVLHVKTSDEEARVSFSSGVPNDVRYGDLRGEGALQALMSHPDESPWTFSFDDSEGACPTTPPPTPRTEDASFEIEVDDVIDVSEAEPHAGESLGSLLLVDDDESLLGLYSKFLERAGFDVSMAVNGRLGLEAALNAHPDVIVSDIMMPERDGWGFLTDVRDDQRLRDTRFVLMSCHKDYVNKLRDLEAGADDYLEKGVRGEEIVERVRAVIEPRRKLLAALKTRGPFAGTLGAVGTMWLLRTLGEAEASGTLFIEEGFSRFEVALDEGRLLHSRASRPGEPLTERDALLALLAVDDAPFTFDPGEIPEDAEPGLPFGMLEGALAEELNNMRQAQRDALLADDAALELDAPLLDFYRSVSPTVVREIVDELGKGRSPRAVMAGGGNPLLVEWVVKDLLRKRVARFAQSKAA
jgi:DNA-binding response OmpR family regulator